MTTVKDFINVTIDRQTRAVTRQGFGTVLVATSVVPVGFTERVRYYTDGADMLTDGFLVSDDAYKAVQAVFSQQPRPLRVGVGRVSLDLPETWTEGLNAIANENNDWYGLVATTRDSDEVLEIAAWVEAFSTTKIYGTASSDPNAGVAVAETDVGFILKSLARQRTFVFWNEDPTTFPEAALFGKNLTPNPGSVTWGFKTLSGIMPSDSLSTTQVTNIQLKNYVLYQTVGGVQITMNPKVSVGEWIDIIHGTDWLNARITEALFALLVNLPKLSYTDKGIVAVTGEVSAVLDVGIKNDFLTDDKPYEVTAPKRKDVASADVAERKLNDVKFKAYYAGAIHFIGVQGVLTY